MAGLYWTLKVIPPLGQFVANEYHSITCSVAVTVDCCMKVIRINCVSFPC